MFVHGGSFVARIFDLANGSGELYIITLWHKIIHIAYPCFCDDYVLRSQALRAPPQKIFQFFRRGIFYCTFMHNARKLSKNELGILDRPNVTISMLSKIVITASQDPQNLLTTIVNDVLLTYNKLWQNTTCYIVETMSFFAVYC